MNYESSYVIVRESENKVGIIKWWHAKEDDKSEGKFTKLYPYNFVTTHTVNTVQRVLFAGG